MPPQIAEVRAVASARKLDIVCAGKSGEEDVLRVRIPQKSDEKFVDELRSDLLKLVNSIDLVDEDKIALGKCDRVSAQSYSNAIPGIKIPEGALQDMAFGPRSLVSSLLQIAITCDFKRAYLRSMTQNDRAYISMAKNAPAVDPGWVVLDAGEDISRRDGPLGCYLSFAARTIGNKSKCR